MVESVSSAPKPTANHLSLVAPVPDKRSGGNRHTVMIPATVVCPDGETHACIVRDLSATGAKLAISRRHRLPIAFELAIPGRDLPYPVERKWQRGDFAGVILVVAGSDAASASD